MSDQDNTTIYNIDDTVYYKGTRFKNELLRDGKSLKGRIHARVQGQPDTWCVEFTEAKPDDRDYILHVSHMTKTPPPRSEKEKQHDGPEVQPRRRRMEED